MKEPSTPRIRRLLRILLIGAPSVFVVAATAIGLWLLTSLPALTGRVELHGLAASVRVFRDTHGVPHIFSGSQRDAFLALGFLHAQDRFWQMETMRRLGSGRLSGVFGEATLSVDKWMRTLGLYRLAELQVDGLLPAAREAADAYADGVNHWLAHAGSLPALEFAFFRYQPEAWKPADSLVWGKVMGTRLGGSHRKEILRALLASRMPPQKVRQLWPGYPRDAPISVVTDADQRAPGKWENLLGGLADLSPWPAGAPQGASNAWVVDGDHTDSKSALLANDPHLGFSAPILWYLARIVTPDWQATGATVPGVPFHILGHNGRIAWGITSTQSDIEDLFIEKVVPGSPERYVTSSGSAAFDTSRSLVGVKGDASQPLVVCRTRHGPVISDLRDDMQRLTGGSHVVALAATYLQPDDRTAQAFYDVARAGTWDEFRAALRSFGAPQQNFIYADTAGDVGFMAPGRVPVRGDGFGTVPSPGWTGKTDWVGYVPFDALPTLRNPRLGRIVNANNRIVGSDYPYFLSSDWEEPFRAVRIDELIDGTPKHTFQSMRAIQLDIIVSAMARRLLPLLLTSLGAVDDEYAAVQAMMRSWDFRMDQGRPEPLVFSLWVRQLNKAVYADDLGDLIHSYLSLRPSFVEFALTEEPAWCDDIDTDTAEDCRHIVRQSFVATIERLREKHGRHPETWRWGNEHLARFDHAVFSRVAVIGRLFNLVTPSDGGNRGASRINNETRPFAHVHGAGYRAVYDLSDLSQSRFVIATGQSGNALSPHFGDMVAPWREGRYIAITGSEKDLIDDGARVLTLVPAALKQ